jgi:hypothetical protein
VSPNTAHRSRDSKDLGEGKAQGGIRRGPPAKPRDLRKGLALCAQPLRGGTASAEGVQAREGSGAREGVRHSARIKASEGEAQERNRNETSPAGRVGSKASRGCETLGTQRNRSGVVPAGGMWLCAAGKTLKGKKPRKGRTSLPGLRDGRDDRGDVWVIL